MSPPDPRHAAVMPHQSQRFRPGTTEPRNSRFRGGLAGPPTLFQLRPRVGRLANTIAAARRKPRVWWDECAARRGTSNNISDARRHRNTTGALRYPATRPPHLGPRAPSLNGRTLATRPPRLDRRTPSLNGRTLATRPPRLGPRAPFAQRAHPRNPRRFVSVALPLRSSAALATRPPRLGRCAPRHPHLPPKEQGMAETILAGLAGHPQGGPEISS